MSLRRSIGLRFISLSRFCFNRVILIRVSELLHFPSSSIRVSCFFFSFRSRRVLRFLVFVASPPAICHFIATFFNASAVRGVVFM